MEKSIDRKPVVNKINNIMSLHSEELKSITYEISNDKQLNKFKLDHPLFKLNPKTDFRYSEIGVWASNYDAWVNFLKTDKEYLVLFEDDVYIHEDFWERIDGIMYQMPSDWQAFFFLNFNQAYYDPYIHNIDNATICKSYQGQWLAGYILNRSGAESLIKSVQENLIEDPIDIYIFYRYLSLRSYTLRPGISSMGGDLGMNTTIHNVERVDVNNA
jgi:GR25 family glycosyltransferase involved in LPS biosynthesis